MTRRIAAVAALILLAGLPGYFWLHSSSRNQPSTTPTQASQDAAVAEALAAQNSNTTAIIASNFARVQAAPQNLPSATADISPAPSGPPSPLQFTNISPAIVLENMSRAIRQYGTMFGGNPVGTNPEITRQLSGNNPRHINFLNPEAGMRINENGELVDPWGTPYFFHQLSGTDMEIHSAGPDKIMWTSDDLVIR
jgi:hypothetical protein